MLVFANSVRYIPTRNEPPHQDQTVSDINRLVMSRLIRICILCEDEGGCIVLKYKNGAMASLTYHVNAADGAHRASILGDKGRIEVYTPFWAADKLTSPTGVHEFPLKPGNYNFPNSAALHYEAAAVRQSLLDGKTESELHSQKDSEMIVNIMDEVRRQLGRVLPQDDE